MNSTERVFAGTLRFTTDNFLLAPPDWITSRCRSCATWANCSAYERSAPGFAGQHHFSTEGNAVWGPSTPNRGERSSRHRCAS